MKESINTIIEKNQKHSALSSIQKIYFSITDDTKRIHLHIEGSDEPITLSSAIAVFENIGISVIQCNLNEYHKFWELIFEIEPFDSLEKVLSSEASTKKITQLLLAIFHDKVENDILNFFALSNPNIIDHIIVIRAISHYLLQLRFNINIHSLYKCLTKHNHITILLIDFFKAKFLFGFQEKITNLKINISEQIKLIESREEDLILQRYFSVLKAITRTNFYTDNYKNNSKSALSLKIEPHLIDHIPKPIPAYEIFIYSIAVEGVHLRGGKVSRGGIRFSDRQEDYRTEVLGLVKTQMIKNSVIVPVGAKGGFICKTDISNLKKTEQEHYIKGCYATYIRAILDITDNRVNGKIVTNQHIIKYDGDDPYLVVAADKGTARFSDFANSIAADYNFWLGDAFASGGTYGYDHKKMGITAKGAWESAKRLLIELGKNVDQETISVVGIGDMSGDVFGNGMMLSRHIQLIAAFNHKHIFIDPNPTTETSYTERQRLFNLPYSSWADYNTDILSDGGGIYERSQKAITLLPEALVRLGLSESDNPLSPDKLIQTILRTQVDMLWNGGIGTYVKASTENNTEVGDKTNDLLRINADELKVSLVAEGGNLGLTQKARIEYALQGGLIHMDAVDNAAGVDCSDHEVNIKILLQDIIKNGCLNHEERNKLLASMAPAVEQLVLKNNFRQSRMLSQSNYTSPHFYSNFVQLINLLESDGVLDRKLAALPSPDNLEQRLIAQENFTRPELATLLAYSKTRLYNNLVQSNLIDDPFFQNLLLKYFPTILADKYASYIKKHPLRNEILASYLTNDIANRMGATFCNYALEEDAENISQLVKAHMIAVEIFNINDIYEAIDQLSHTVDSQVLLDLQLAIHYPLDKTMNWLIQNGMDGSMYNLITHYNLLLKTFKNNVENYLPETHSSELMDKVHLSTKKGVTEKLAHDIHLLNYCYYVLPLAAIAKDNHIPFDNVLRAFFSTGEELSIFWLYDLINHISTNDSWRRKHKRLLTRSVEVQHIKAVTTLIQSEKESHSAFPKIANYLKAIGSAKAKPAYNFSMATVLADKLSKVVS